MKNLELFEQAIDLQDLTHIEINTDGNDYPRGLGAVGAIGFNQFSEAEAFAEQHGGEVVVFKTRDGHHFWRNEGRAYSPFTAHDYIDGADDNTNLITEEDLTDKFWEDLMAATEDKDIDEVDYIFENYKEHLADIQAAGDGKVCFFDGNTNEIGTLDETFMEYRYDVYSYAIGVYFHPSLHEEGADDKGKTEL